ncbi:hypothetical protein [Actinoplanes sp. NBRC 103695]|uniref:TolB family protein n=1 Tax=Actinoplanes sp. NBRC 103695 TaxID=3032202 RepID=UPI00249FFD4A|nr:hypothetical protein [Actinoplanes sp. NBRC 103695]GLY92840.1 TolB-like translocation protein; signal peptide [Actinoplanes sp. NBRC 103695]
MKARVGIAVASAVVLASVAVGYAALARDDSELTAYQGRFSLTPGPSLLTVTDRHLALVDAADPGGPRGVSPVECLRAFAAAGTGVCLRPTDPWSNELVVLDADLKPERAFAIPGQPNRARVSPSGRMVAWTTFVGGDSYATGGFSTRTGILDTTTGATVMSLESFAITRDGKPYRNVDVNYWGVTFARDDNTFYATLGTAGERYLVRGDWTARRVVTLKANVECPSLSPDGTRVAFKEAVAGDPARGWRLSVLDLATMRVTATAETASVDDQAAWLDDRTLAYTLRQDDGRPDVHAVPANGTGAPHLLVPGAESPSSLR